MKSACRRLTAQRGEASLNARRARHRDLLECVRMATSMKKGIMHLSDVAASVGYPTLASYGTQCRVPYTHSKEPRVRYPTLAVQSLM